MRGLATSITLISVIFFSCRKDLDLQKAASAINPTFSSSSLHVSPPSVTYPFAFNGSGPFTISPVSPTVVRIEQFILFASASPFPLVSGNVQGFDDLTIPTFPERFFNGSFKFSGQGNDSVFATVTVQTSVFSDPVDPTTGDFTGSEDFTGTFNVTGGTGRYIGATGAGAYSAHSEWRPPLLPGTFFSGSTSVIGTGTVSVFARNGQLESLTH